MSQGVTPPGASGVAPAFEFFAAYLKRRLGNTTLSVGCLIHEASPRVGDDSQNRLALGIRAWKTKGLENNGTGKQREWGTNDATPIDASVVVEDEHDYKTLKTQLLKWTR